MPKSSTQKKKRRQRKLWSSQSKKSKVTNAVIDEVAQEKGRNAEAITDKRPRALSMPSLGGLVILEKVYEPLQAAFQANNN